MFQDVSSELLRLGYGIRFCPHGHSMHPTIRDGEAVTVEPVEARDVRRGDIILYQTGKRVIAHRVVRVEGREAISFILRGDASRDCDAPVSGSQVLGRITAVERGGRSLRLANRRHTLRRAAYRVAARLAVAIYQYAGKKRVGVSNVCSADI